MTRKGAAGHEVARTRAATRSSPSAGAAPSGAVGGSLQRPPPLLRPPSSARHPSCARPRPTYPSAPPGSRPPAPWSLPTPATTTPPDKQAFPRHTPPGWHPPARWARPPRPPAVAGPGRRWGPRGRAPWIPAGEGGRGCGRPKREGQRGAAREGPRGRAPPTPAAWVRCRWGCGGRVRGCNGCQLTASAAALQPACKLACCPLQAQ